MVMKTYFKSILRSVKSNIARFVSIIVIMILGIAFVSGLGTLSPTIKDSFSARMNEVNFYDIIIKCKTDKGFTQETVDQLTAMDEVQTVEVRTCIDMWDDETRARLYIYDGFDSQINTVELLDGQYPSASNEVLVERGSNELPAYAVGDEITLNFMGREMKYKVVGVLGNSLIYDCFGEPFINPDTQEADEYLEKIVYFDREFFPLANFFPKTDAYIRLDGLPDRDFFSDEYMDEVEGEKQKKRLFRLSRRKRKQ